MSDTFVPVQVVRIRQERPRAFQLVLANGIVTWVPKAAVLGYEHFSGGDWDVELQVASWFHEPERFEIDSP